MKKSAIVTGATGQTGSYFTELLLEKGYKVYVLKRRTSSNSFGNISHLVNHPDVEIFEGDLTDASSILKLCILAKADIFANYAAQSHVGLSFKQPETTFDIDARGVLNCLEGIRNSGVHTRFVQSSTSEMFGGMPGTAPQNEQTPFHPRSPYGVAKLAAYWLGVNYRESYKMFVSNTFMFNNESPRRANNFVTRKVTKAVANIKAGLQDKLYLGNLDSKRDWGHAKDYSNASYLVLNHNKPDDFVVATGKTHSIRELCEVAFSHVGLDYRDYVEIDPRFYRPAEVDVLLGDSSKIRRELGWEPEYTFETLIKEMVDYDLSKL
jgi:GDPmannose 4,6-dehydratase